MTQIVSVKCNHDDGQASANVDGGGGVIDEDDSNQMKTGPSEMKISMVSVKFYFVPHLIINHLRMDKCLFLHMIFFYFLQRNDCWNQ